VAISLFGLVVVLWMPYGVLMEHLRQRERIGECVIPNGDMGSGELFPDLLRNGLWEGLDGFVGYVEQIG